MAPLQEETMGDDGPCYYGVIKSYNERRGFGFVACEETARNFGRDVYLSKEEASQLAKEGAAASAASTDEPQQPPLKEGDFVSFQVQKKHRGVPPGGASKASEASSGVSQSGDATKGSARG